MRRCGFAVLLGLLFALVMTLRIDVGPTTVYAIDFVLWPALVAFVLIAGVFGKRTAFSGSAGSAMTICGIVLLIGFLSLLFSADPLRGVPKYQDWLRAVAAFSLSHYLLRIGAIDSRIVGRAWWIVGAFLVAVGVIQAVTGSRFLLVADYFGARPPSAADVYRVSGTVRNPIVFSLWVGIFGMLPIAALLAKGRALASAVAITVIGAGATLSLSRGAVLAFIAGTACMLVITLYHTGRIRHLLPVLIVAVAVSRPAVGDAIRTARLLERFENTRDGKRGEMILAGFRIAAHPKVLVVGIGPGTFHPVAERLGYDVQPSRYKSYASTDSGIHNTPLQVLVEYGALFLVGWLVIAGYVIRGATRLLRHSSNLECIVWGTYIVGLFGLLGIASVVYEELLVHYVTIPLGIASAVTLELERRTSTLRQT